MTKSHARRRTRVGERPVLVLFNSDEELRSAARLLKSRTTADVVRLGPVINQRFDGGSVVRVRDAAALQTWLRESRRTRTPASVQLALASDFDLHQRTMSALADMRVQLPQVLSSGQDQIFVLDREQRMVAFFGSWPKHSPRRPQDLLGKRKSEVFGADAAAVHDAAALRALNGEEAAYEWTVTDAPGTVYLFTTASPLRNDEGKVAGVLLVTRNITPLKQAQLETERALQDKTNQLLEIERGVRRVAAALQSSSQDTTEQAKTSGLHTSSFLSKRESQVLNLLRRGARLRSIAHTLGISIETVRRHVKAMFRKTGVHSQEALVKLFFGADES
jgi:PAS domain S-box-containing protein